MSVLLPLSLALAAPSPGKHGPTPSHSAAASSSGAHGAPSTHPAASAHGSAHPTVASLGPTGTHKPGDAKSKGWHPIVPAGYQAARKHWHDDGANLPPTLDASGRPMLVLNSINTGQRVALAASSDDGGFDALALLFAARVLHDPRTGLSHPVDPHTLDFVYQAMRHFHAPEVRVISGYRAPKPRNNSNHGKGRAIDIVLPGVSEQDLSSWARSQGYVGVGVYPHSGFCHFDVRPHSYAWMDNSGPGQRNREVPIHHDESASGDQHAHATGKEPILPFTPPSPSVDLVWSKATPLPVAPEESPNSEEDQDEPAMTHPRSPSP